MRTTALLLTGALLLTITMQSFGLQSGSDSLYTVFHVNHQSTSYAGGPLADLSQATIAILEEDQSVESWMATPFVFDESMEMESWMVTPFPFEEELGMESWMGLPFLVDEEVEVESWMSESWMKRPPLSE